MYLVVQDETQQWLGIHRLCNLTTHVIDAQVTDCGTVALLEIVPKELAPAAKYGLACDQVHKFHQAGISAQVAALSDLNYARELYEAVLQGREVLAL